MTYKEKETAKAFIESANEKALRTFVTGLNNKSSDLLYAANPSTLPEAYTRLQTIMNDQKRIGFAHRHNFKSEERTRHPQFGSIQQQNRRTENSQGIAKSSSRVEPMEVDRTSTAVNVERNQSNRFQPQKREFSRNNTSFNQQKKTQRINNVNDEADYARTIAYDERPDEDFDKEYDPSSDASDETSSIFLGN